jgi:phosphoglycerate kinase
MVKKPEAVAVDDKIVDIGPDSVALIAPHIAAAKFILWNGPTGLYEDGFVSYTQGIAELIAKSGARVVIGGGDTIAVIEDSETLFGPNVFLSTGGGAMLEFLLDGTLPGVDALNQ